MITTFITHLLSFPTWQPSTKPEPNDHNKLQRLQDPISIRSPPHPILPNPNRSMVVEGKKITLKSCIGEKFGVEEIMAMESQTSRHMIEDDCTESSIPLPNITTKILAKVIQYRKKHVDSAAKPSTTDDKAIKEDLKAWDADFIKVD